MMKNKAILEMSELGNGDILLVDLSERRNVRYWVGYSKSRKVSIVKQVHDKPMGTRVSYKPVECELRRLYSYQDVKTIYHEEVCENV